MSHPRHSVSMASYFVICALADLSILSFASMLHVSAISPQESGFKHGCDDSAIEDASDRYINQPSKGPAHHTDIFNTSYDAGFGACSGNDSDLNPSYDCSDEADGCMGIIYCDLLKGEGSCYDRYEGNDDGSSTDPADYD